MKLLLIALLLISSDIRASNPQKYQSLSSIQQAAESFLAKQITSPDSHIRINSIDSRLKLKQCTKPLEAYPAPGNKTIGRVTVGVRCRGEVPWSLYVSSQVMVKQKQVTTTRPLAKGQIISIDDLKLIEKYSSNQRFNGYQSIHGLIGKQIKRNLSANVVLKPNHIKIQHAIKRGNMVIIRSSNPKISVSMKGKAMQKGSVGDTIKVKNMTSKRIVDAQIIANGVVQPIGS